MLGGAGDRSDRVRPAASAGHRRGGLAHALVAVAGRSSLGPVPSGRETVASACANPQPLGAMDKLS